MQRPDLSSTGQYIAWYARETPGKTAVVEYDLPITYRGLAADLVRCLQVLNDLGVRPGMLVGLQISLRYHQLVLLLACELAGAAAASLSAEEIAAGYYIARYCDIILADAAPAADGPPRVVALPRIWLAGLAAEPPDLTPLERRIAPEQVARIVRTSGTTGRPKAMPMTHHTQQLRVTRMVERAAGILPEPRFLCLYSLAVASLYMRILGVLQHGGTVFLGAGEQVDTLLADGTVNYVTFSLGDLEQTVQRMGARRIDHPLNVSVFGATVSPSLRQLARERLNARIGNSYAANETNAIAVIGDDNVGTLCEGVEVRIVDAAGRDVPPGEAGLIRVRTEAMVSGYFNDPVQTQAAFIDGWYDTNDAGFMPVPGKLILLGRADGMLNIGGVKVPPSSIEARIKLIDGINDVIVMSVTGGNDVGALLVAVEIGAAAPPANLARDVAAAVSHHLNRFTLMPLARFPRTDTGKIKRHEIEAAFRSGLGQIVAVVD